MKLSVAQALEKYSKPGSQGHILPATYFCAALELRMVFPDEWIKNRNITFELQLSKMLSPQKECYSSRE